MKAPMAHDVGRMHAPCTPQHAPRISEPSALCLSNAHHDPRSPFSTNPQVRVTSVADVAAMGKQALVMRAREITRSLEPSFFVPGVLSSFKDNRVLAEVGCAWLLHGVSCFGGACLGDGRWLCAAVAILFLCRSVLVLRHCPSTEWQLSWDHGLNTDDAGSDRTRVATARTHDDPTHQGSTASCPFNRPSAWQVLMTVGLCTLDMLLAPGPLDEPSAVFVAASIVLGLEHLHWSHTLYRGLSVHSVIVTEGGQVQLVDFRFARKDDGRAYTLCGNPE